MKSRTASLYVALTVALLNLGLLIYLRETIVIIVIFSFLASIVTYFATNFLIERYIHERLKVVYRTIHNKSKEDASTENTTDVIERARTVVSGWEEEKNNEIERLRKTDVYRKEFVANVTHELKTPLFNIQGYIHSLIDGAIHDPEVNTMFLDKASKNVDRLVTLVSDLDVITQLETGGAVFEPEVFDITTLVKEMFESLEFKAAQRSKKLILSNDKAYYVYADKDKIRQVIVNLVENSIKYGNENGRTFVNITDAVENIIIEVGDDGPGIPEEHLPRLFERFYRVDKSRSREAGGTGLGLAIVKHIIEGHGKTINVRSKVGEGTTFSFSLEKR